MQFQHPIRIDVWIFVYTVDLSAVVAGLYDLMLAEFERNSAAGIRLDLIISNV